MIRNLKVLGIAVVSALAMSAMIASAAQATNGTVTLDGGNTPSANFHAVQSAGQPHTFTLEGGRQVRCDVATFEGTVANNATNVVVAPTYQECEIEIGIGGAILPATVTMNECEYNFTIGTTTTEPNHFWHSEVHLECPNHGGTNQTHVQIHVYAPTDISHTGANVCTYTIAPQSVTGVEGRNLAGGEVSVFANDAPVNYTKTTGTISNCGPSTGVAEYFGDTRADAEDEGGSVSIQLH